MSLPAVEVAARAVAVHAPHLQHEDLVLLGAGEDNTAFRCGDLVVRVANGRSTEEEEQLLLLLGPRVSIPVPAPLIADEDLGVLAYPLLPGRPLLGRVPPPGAARRLGVFLSELHGLDASLVTGVVEEESADPHEWLQDLTGPEELLAVLHASVPAPGGRRVLAHADLGAEHLLEDGGVLTGVLDWSDAAVTDPALDFARLYRDFGPSFLGEVLDTYSLPAPDALARIEVMARIKFFARCAALEDLTFARLSGRREYADAAHRSLQWLFPGTGLE